MDKTREQQQLDTNDSVSFGDRPEDRDSGPRGDWQGYDLAILTALDD